MLKQLINSTRKKLWKSEEQENIVTPLNKKAVFELQYKDLLIGTLKLEKGIWSFTFKQREHMIQVDKPVSLLKLFGERSISNPFLLRMI